MDQANQQYNIETDDEFDQLDADTQENIKLILKLLITMIIGALTLMGAAKLIGIIL